MRAASGSQTAVGKSAGRWPGWPAAPPLLAGAALRLWMMKAIPQVQGDTLLYGNLAKNLLLHGQYALADGSGVLHRTLIRLPGYPLFLAACFRLFGVDNYNAAIWVQIAMDLAGCMLLAGFARRIASPRAALGTLWLAALCPFTAVYAVAPLTEAPTLFSISLALWAMGEFGAQPRWRYALAFTSAIAMAAMLRPDGVLAGAALAPALILAAWRTSIPRARLATMLTACLLLAALPFAAWTVRNWRVFHVFQPLAPRYATDPGEPVNAGWQRWMKTWCLDFTSTYDIYWNVPDGPFDVSKLPARAFDNEDERVETARLAKEYANNGQDLTPELDAAFARLAEERIELHPLRYYLWLPLGRLADMWLRPRVENLNIDLDWWVYAHHHDETVFSWAYAALNALYILLAVAGIWRRPRYWGWMVLYMALRSALLMTIEAPEARYTLECFPMLFVLGGIGGTGSREQERQIVFGE